MKVRASERDPMRKNVFTGALVVPASLPQLQTKPAYVSFPSLTVHSLIHTYTRLLYVSTEAPAGGRKRGNMREVAKEGTQRKENGE